MTASLEWARREVIETHMLATGDKDFLLPLALQRILALQALLPAAGSKEAAWRQPRFQRLNDELKRAAAQNTHKQRVSDSAVELALRPRLFKPLSGPRGPVEFTGGFEILCTLNRLRRFVGLGTLEIDTAIHQPDDIED